MRNRALALLLLALVPSQTQAQTPTQAPTPTPNPTPPNPQTIVVTATRTPTPIAAIAAGVTVIDATTIQDRGYTTLAQALAAIPGTTIVPTGAGVATVFIRGTNSNQVQVLLDGIPINDPSGPGEAYNFGTETLAGVTRIEIVRGPLSALYGSGAIGGVVNIITAPPTTPTATATLAAGYPAALLAQADLRGTAGPGSPIDYSLSAQSRSDAGADDTPTRETPIHTGERDGQRTQSATLTLGYTPTQGTRLFLNLRGRTTVYGYDDVGYPAFDDPNQTARDNDSFAQAGLASTLFHGAWHTQLSAAQDQQYRRYTNLLDPTDPNAAAEDSRYLGQRTTLQFNNTIDLPDTAISRAATLIAGAEHTDATARERLDATYAATPYLASVHATDHRDSGYAGVQETLLGTLTLNANARAETVSGVGRAYTWRTGASLALPTLATHLKASIGTAFRAPSLFDRYGIDSDGYIGNPNLRPEHSQSTEIGFTTQLAPHTSIDATWFHTTVKNLIETVFAPTYTSANIARARLQGLETSLHLHPASWIDADLTYTYTDARDATTGTQLLRRPYDTGSATLTLHPTQTLTLTPQLTFAGADRDALIDNQGYPAGQGTNPGGLIVNLAISNQLTAHLAVFATARNLTDTRYEPANGFALPGPSVLVGVRVTGL